MEDDVLALIVAKPGRVRDGLQALLAAMPQIETISLADDCAEALKVIEGHCSALMLLDANLADGNGAWTVLKQVKQGWPQIQCLVLTNNGRQGQMAQAAGADSVLIKGAPAGELFATIEKLLSTSKTNGQEPELIHFEGLHKPHNEI